LVPGLPPTVPGGPPLQLAKGEDVRIATVMPHGVELEQPLRNTWPGGDESAWVLGNVVPVRRGLTNDWTLVGRGGAALGDIAHQRFLGLPFELVRRLRAEVEDARAAWITRAALVAQWTTACQTVSQLRRDLQRIDVDAYDVRDPGQRLSLEQL